MQELEEAAVGVVEAHKRISALLEEKAAELAIIKEEYDTKKKEVRLFHQIWRPEGLRIVCPHGRLRLTSIFPSTDSHKTGNYGAHQSTLHQYQPQALQVLFCWGLEAEAWEAKATLKRACSYLERQKKPGR